MPGHRRAALERVQRISHQSRLARHSREPGDVAVGGNPAAGNPSHGGEYPIVRAGLLPGRQAPPASDRGIDSRRRTSVLSWSRVKGFARKEELEPASSASGGIAFLL